MAPIKFDRGHKCVACGSTDVHFVRRIRSRRSGDRLNFYYCRGCGSFAMPSDFERSDAYLEKTVAFHESIVERNEDWSRELFERLRSFGVSPKSVIEIGAGNGAALAAARDAGAQHAIGFELNPHVAAFARARYPAIEMREALWDERTEPAGADLVLCLSVIEHINDPNPLIRSIGAYAAQNQSLAALSVPLHGRHHWEYVFVPLDPKSPFRAGDEHVLYFSEKGFRQMLTSAGAMHISLESVGGWNVFLAAFDKGTAARLERATAG